MGCRAFLSPWKDENGKEKYAGRFNIGATSINLPRIAIKIVVMKKDSIKNWIEF